MWSHIAHSSSNNVALVKLLVEAGAAVRGHLFRNILSPLEIVRKLELAGVYEELNPDQSDDEDFEVRFYDHILQRSATESSMAAEATDADKEITRASTDFLTGLVGDVGTCKSNPGIMERSGMHDWVTVFPGDLHIKGSLCECCYKEQGDGGLLYVARTAMRRSKLSPEVFKDKKYKEDNLRKIKEAVRDVARSYSIAAVVQFKLSEFYPSPEALWACTRKTGNQNQVILELIKKFLEFSCSRNNAFKYRSQMFLHYGPLLELFDFIMAHNRGLAREVIFFSFQAMHT